ncbi:MAG: ABC transporter ATP-binding protein [Alphaproteobacteria bacterium]|nr:ABC transporter ATP-binding protein [Alphaproteobacteria bacterium]
MSRPLLQVTDLQKTFGAVTAAKDINVAVTEGEVVGIIGANGAGKTTFVNMVTGYLKPSAGRIAFRGKNIIGLKPREITRLGICRSFQVSQVFMTMTAFENLLTALAIAESPGIDMLRPIHRAELEERCEQILHTYQIDAYRDQPASELPQGVRKLLDIAMAMVVHPKILLLDEPTSGISIEEKFGIMTIIMRALKEASVTVLFVEHDMEIVERYVSRVLAFYQGEIICDAPPAEALVNDAVQEYVIGKEHHATVGGGAAPTEEAANA